jgi:hypothetical protein
MFDVLSQVEDSLAVKKISVVEFAESDEYCDKPLYPRQRVLLKLMFLEELTGEEEDILNYWIAGGRGGTEIEICPDVRERVQWLRDAGYKHFRQVNLVGGRRSSKGFVTGVAMAKIMFDTLQLQDPGRFYGIDPQKNIMFSCIAGSEEQAREYQFSDLTNTIEHCKAFDKFLVKSLETELRVATQTDLLSQSKAKARGNKIQKDIARLRAKALASNAGTIRGSATMAVCIDEMAFMMDGLSKASADVVYQAIEPSLSQFGRDAMMFCNSSPYTKLGKFFEQYELGMKPLEKDGNPRTLTFRYPSWALFEGYQKDPKKRFRKAMMVSADWNVDDKDEQGNDLWSEDDKALILQEKSNEQSNPEAYKVERRAQFAEVTDAFLNPVHVDNMFAGTIVGYDERQEPIYEPLETNWGDGIRNIYRYKAHLDPSSTTAGFGFALGHLEEFVLPSGKTQQHVVFDIIKRWNPRNFRGGAIEWNYVLNEVMGYIRLFRPYELTLDQYQSHEPIQTLNIRLREEGLNTRVYEKTATPELNWRRAETFKTALYHGMVHAPYDTDDIKYGALELKFLQQQNTASKYPRIDHPTVGDVKTKDIADCIMDVTASLLGNLINDQLQGDLANNMILPGAPGGYRIGGGDDITARSRATPDAVKAVMGKRKGEQVIGTAAMNRQKFGMSTGRRRSRGR